MYDHAFLHVKWTRSACIYAVQPQCRLIFSYFSIFLRVGVHKNNNTESQKQFMISALGVCKSADSAGYSRGLDLPVFCCVRCVRRAAASRLQSLL